MTGPVFVDTNVLVYRHDAADAQQAGTRLKIGLPVSWSFAPGG